MKNALTEDFPGELISVTPSAGYADRRIRVEHELNYLYPCPPWIPGVDGAKHPSDFDALCNSVTAMARYSPGTAQVHYSETLAALERMHAIERPAGWPNG